MPASSPASHIFSSLSRLQKQHLCVIPLCRTSKQRLPSASLMPKSLFIISFIKTMMPVCASMINILAFICSKMDSKIPFPKTSSLSVPIYVPLIPKPCCQRPACLRHASRNPAIQEPSRLGSVSNSSSLAHIRRRSSLKSLPALPSLFLGQP